MIEINRLPTGGDVTGAALTRIMRRWRIAGVAGRAIGEASVIEIGRQPRARQVAGAALPFVVIGGLIGRVAGHAVRQPRMIERRR